ncbi:MAG: DUF1064 domain-containing protein [Clostridiales bacterium]|jgi:hypothetical protein|nr:DUF1064 domain-containing protein [Clostridiales bacterium]
MTYPRPSKYGNKRTVIDGIRFDSKAEGRRYQQLKLLERAGEITRLELQKPFKLHAGIVYKADFTYHEFASNACIAEDIKGVETKEFKLKKRLFKADYPEWELRVIPAKEV